MRGVTLAAALATLTLAGCTAFRGQASLDWPWLDSAGNPTTPCSANCAGSAGLDAYMRAAHFCRNVALYYENGGRASGLSKLAVGTIGVLAGSVAAPIAQGTAATAWSGLSGATNALQIPMEQTFSASLATSRQNAVVQAASDGAKAYRDAGTDVNKQVIAGVNMALGCSLAPAQADQQALKSISSPATGQQIKITAP